MYYFRVPTGLGIDLLTQALMALEEQDKRPACFAAERLEVTWAVKAVRIKFPGKFYSWCMRMNKDKVRSC